MLTGPAFIPLVAFSSADYTVTVTDANGNPPTGDNTVDIVVQGIDASDVTGGGEQTVGADGTVMFSIRVPFGAMQGDQVAIGVLVDGDVKDSMVITFGEEVVVPPVLGDASGLMAEAGATAGMVELTWTPGPNATRHFVAGVKQSDLAAGTITADNLIWTFADNPGSHTEMGLESGEVYLFVVIAGDADGWGAWTAPQMVTPN